MKRLRDSREPVHDLLIWRLLRQASPHETKPIRPGIKSKQFRAMVPADTPSTAPRTRICIPAWL